MQPHPRFAIALAVFIAVLSYGLLVSLGAPT